MGRLLSVNVGLPRDITWQGKTVHTAIWKAPVQGPRMVRRLNIDGDGQGDLAGHGGERRAVFVYQMDSYRYWESQLGRNDFIYGQFGENFTVDGLSDTEVCIGDRYRIGTALFEVTQPRVTCYRLGIRLNEPEMAALVVKHGRPGFYFRVLDEGKVEAGDEIRQVASGPERMSVFEINSLLYIPGHPRNQLERALRIPALSAGWHRSFEALLTQERKGGATTGNAGLTAASGPPPAWRGFRPFRVSRKVRESGNVISLALEPTDGQPIAAALPGQFVVLRLGPASASDRRQAEGLLQLHREMEVGYCRLVTISTDNITQTNENRSGIEAHWPFLSDPRRIVQKDLDIAEYTDPVNNPMIPHVVVLEPGLVIHKIYNGYWFFGRPTMEELRQDLRAVSRKCRPDWDITTPELKAAWQEGRKESFYPYGKTYLQTLGEQD